MRKFICFIFIILFSISANAATYYVDTDAADDNGAGGESTPKKYIKSGIELMSAGDTLIIEDGTYTGENNCPYFYGGIPNGNSGADETAGTDDDIYTTIKARNDYSVIIDGEATRATWYVGTDGSPISFVKFEGMIFYNSTKSCFMIVSTSSSYCKVLRCAAYETGYGDAFNFASQGDHHLFEDCFAWGSGRYKFCCGTDYTILRRCVARYDYHDPDIIGENGNPDPYADFAFYHHTYGVMQNCIAIDNLDVNSVRPDPETRSFQGANGNTAVTIDSCIALNTDGRGIVWESTNPDSFIKNTVVWDVGSYAIIPITLDEGNPVTIDHVTVGTIDDPYDMTYGVTTWSSVTTNGMPVTNSLFYGIVDASTAGIRNANDNDYNALYNNYDDFSGCTAGANSICADNSNAIDPIDGTPGNGTTAFKYLVRIEDSSDLDGAGSSSSDIGATITKKLGVSGTVYGQTGYDTLTDDDLWPFPQEDIIKTHMAAYNLHSITGARGFAASGKQLNGTDDITLTSYIWEYLGNQIPSDIYGSETPSATHQCSGSFSGG